MHDRLDTMHSLEMSERDHFSGDKRVILFSLFVSFYFVFR